ncbi:hypothetical protein CC85DRAFT_282198 [Cutaneotrichosporon oleaginosum]|uniref:Uncharacterized protein n=1 Tax=Cutaneotrichosporon oleaginosum TaxID=879819 RepID=A0A0J0XYD6_9TREE|nr:uncharacterized protein CC85DRAFT_282198 [Cutaneotrichosporon oleaginosum]KLT46060.1 hypothetical protein CC85DRAFT_282198 [Cutaneotrichosporon oleaginosum]TXT06753.1 hypothetical protein COLE_06084 [Cutaneotrichosporon oleaginosum]
MDFCTNSRAVTVPDAYHFEGFGQFVLLVVVKNPGGFQHGSILRRRERNGARKLGGDSLCSARNG